MAHLPTLSTRGALPATGDARPCRASRWFLWTGSHGLLHGAQPCKDPLTHAAPSPLKVYNRSVGKCEQLQKELGADKVQICDIIFTSLANDAVVKGVYEQYAQRSRCAKPPTKKKIIVEMSTVYPSLVAGYFLSGIPHTHLLSGPVFGPPAAADAGDLVCVLAGEYQAKQEVAYVLVPGVGKKAMDLGGNLEKAPTFKLIGNSMILGSLEILAEAFTLSEKTGIGSATTYELIKDLFPAPSFINYGNRMATDSLDGQHGFAVDGGLKDASHMRRLLTEYNSPMPMIDAAHNYRLTARAIHQEQKKRGEQEFDILDWSGLVAGTRVAAGMDAFSSAQSAKVVKE
ncbi:uncharacterized protein B0H18DRAFT_1081104 [Fomitopsis serialis]|uniref:uncharacterized protein n=1 Tax=Fomitopsis serialis TaxID=139415 RepID=UPI002007383F|nr:uncharacterized protein B0H18DRAFT_1081104 [Neoantrodia serialis]KAH9938436.1 hypothetical protein B0H18DRAFT_1081104 [Neoantrodia serialis]